MTIRLLDGRHGPKDFNLHRAILAQKSSYFRTLFLGDSKEASAKIIELSGNDEKAFEAMLQYIYGVPVDWNKWTSSNGEETEGSQAASFFIYLSRLADKYSIDGLNETLKDQLQLYVSNIKSEAKLEEFLRAVYTLIPMPGTGLGKLVARAVNHNPHCDAEDDKAKYAKLVIDIPILAADQMLADLEPKDAYSMFNHGGLFCEDCGKDEVLYPATEFSVEIRHDACGRTFPRLNLYELRQQIGASPRSEAGSSQVTREYFSRYGSPYGSHYGGSLGSWSRRSNSLGSAGAFSAGGTRLGFGSRSSSPGFNSPPSSPRNRSRSPAPLSPSRRSDYSPPSSVRGSAHSPRPSRRR